MLYIDKEAREKYDLAIDNIIKLVRNQDITPTAGDLAYILYKICIGARTRFGYVTFARLNMVIGVLDNVKDEFRRRYLHLFMEAKKQANGDE